MQLARVDRSTVPAAIALPREYNAALEFIDANLAKGRAEKTAFIDDSGRYTYSELAERVNRAGNALRTLGAGLETRVLMCMLDGIDFPAVFWGAIKAGCVPVPINTLLTAEDYAHLLRDSRARIAVVSEALLDRFAPALVDQSYVERVVVAGGETPDHAHGTAAGNQVSGREREAAREGRTPGHEHERTAESGIPGREREAAREGRTPGHEHERTAESGIPGREREAAGEGRVPGHERGAAAGSEAPGYERLADLLAAAPAQLDAAPTTCDDVAFWLYTSGSTGTPKGSMHLHRNLIATAEHYGVATLGIREDDVVYSAAKLFFAYGLGNGMTFPFYVGATTVVLAGRPTPDAVMALLRERRPTIFYGVPTLYGAMLAQPSGGDEDDGLAGRQDASTPGDGSARGQDNALAPGDIPARGGQGVHAPAKVQPPSGEDGTGPSRLRLAVSAGEALPAEIGAAWEARFGAPVLDGLGSTEMLHIFLSNREGDVRYGTSGKAVPGYALKVVAETGEPAAPGEIGELWVSGGSSAVAYWNRREKSLDTFHGPWTRTGDKYVVDGDGYYHYRGRTDDMLKVSGQWVSPFEVESAILGHEAVLEAAVVAAEDEQGLVKPKAFVVVREGVEAGPELAAALQEFVKDRLAPFKYPRWIAFADSLPKTATGKIQRFRLRG